MFRSIQKGQRQSNSCTSVTDASLLSKPFGVVANASKNASGTVLMQEGQAITFNNRKFNKAELNYMVSKEEMLASLHVI